MKLRHLLPVLLLCLPVLVSAETVDFDDLVKREGLWYKKFTDVPFTGKARGYVQLAGQVQTTYKDGKEHGPYVSYHDNGQLHGKGTFKNGKWDGPVVRYYQNGQVEWKGTFKNGKRDGPWGFYNEDGTKRMTPDIIPGVGVVDEGSGFYKDGKKVPSQ